jgi:hypothetical protein
MDLDVPLRGQHASLYFKRAILSDNPEMGHPKSLTREAFYLNQFTKGLGNHGAGMEARSWNEI